MLLPQISPTEIHFRTNLRSGGSAEALYQFHIVKHRCCSSTLCRFQPSSMFSRDTWVVDSNIYSSWTTTSTHQIALTVGQSGSFMPMTGLQLLKPNETQRPYISCQCTYDPTGLVFIQCMSTLELPRLVHFKAGA